MDGDKKVCAGYATPNDAIRGSREIIAYVTCVAADWKLTKRRDFLATIDLDPKSPTYSKVINRLEVPYLGDELHHTGWNACSSCCDSSVKRNYFIMPGLNSDRIYIIDVSDQHVPKIYKIVEPSEMHTKADASAPHTVHCLPNGDVMISCLGNSKGAAKGSFILLQQGTFEIKGTWGKENTEYNYDFWYQPRHNVMVSTEWASPNVFKKGFYLEDFEKGLFGHSINFWDWKKQELIKTCDLSPDGHIPLEVRFLHDPDSTDGYVGCALSSTVFRIFKNEIQWDAEKVIEIHPLKVKNWIMPTMPGLITDVIISMDDRYLYLSNFVQGDVRQYDISNRKNPKLVGQVFLGGSMCDDSQVIVEENVTQPQRCVLKGKCINGGPQMLQLSLDGKRLYVTNSLHSAWDTQFYPENLVDGSIMMLLNVNTVNGGLTVDPDFLVEFGLDNGGPALAHEMRFPGGDCTSDIWI